MQTTRSANCCFQRLASVLSIFSQESTVSHWETPEVGCQVFGFRTRLKFLFFFTKPTDNEPNTGQRQREANNLCQIYRRHIYCTNTADTQSRGRVKQTSIHSKYKAKCRIFCKKKTNSSFGRHRSGMTSLMRTAAWLYMWSSHQWILLH